MQSWALALATPRLQSFGYVQAGRRLVDGSHLTWDAQSALLGVAKNPRRLQLAAFAMALHALLTVLLAPCVLASSKSVPRAELDLFVLVREYSPTFCSKEVCTIKPM